ncbi:peptide ABC transporter substrate-binding protein [Paracoccus saliphilus]|uniref:Peptide ABC transporter substrate-binding protein n=1 Tax=Paracoccus saliphilus TaxID=405559 RepID=A0AA45W8E3_9RHOB|nr:peptide ABC transporter substrate-binding protein [Paracoccus saliphilus]WCR02963.1 peptide ABC transporter substrate-binding protein [Paracoccus saliphilus]SIT16459.1 peptide/nickel transport system substrate-binding protein [Paracoccus saliphilus]
MTSSRITRRGTMQMMGLAGTAGLFAPNLFVSTALAAQPDSPTGQIIVGFSQEPTVFNPLMPRIEVDDGVQLSLFDALFRISPEGEFIPALAAEVPTVENGGLSEDGLEWRIKLRDDVKWHDGEPFTAEDVKFTLDLVVDPEFRSWRTTGHDLVRDLTVVSPTEITWRMEEPFAPYMAILVETMMVPKHILGPEEDRNNAPFNQAPVGTGAFKWGSRTAGDHLELVANPDYFGEGPYIERLIYKYIPDLTVLYTQFKSGDIDIAGSQYITPDNYEEAKSLPGKVVEVVPSPTVESLFLNMERPQFKDKAVREALYAALDKQAIIDALYYGLPTPTESYLPQQSFFYNPDLPKHEFNIERANQILDDAGWAPGAGGIREKDGVRLSFSNSTTSGNHLREQAQQFMQQTFAEIGVEMTISNKPPAVMWGDYWTNSEFDTVIVGIVFTTGADADVTVRFHSGAIPAQDGAGSNTGQYQNEEVDKLLEQGTSTFVPEERKEIYHQLQEIVRDDLPLLPMFQYATVRGHKEGIKGIVPNINTRIDTWHAAAYYWDS